jgi:hypothetical protein
MNLLSWWHIQIKTMKWYDFAFLKIALLAFALLVAKIFPDIVSLEWC